MICPIVGKARVIGAIVVADKEPGEEFFSNDSKLLSTIATEAGLAIENALLYSELEALLLGAIRPLVKRSKRPHTGLPVIRSELPNMPSE